MSDYEVNKTIHTVIMKKCWHEVKSFSGRFGGYTCCVICKKQPCPSNPNYCNSISDVFDVEEELRKSGWCITLSCISLKIGFQASFAKIDKTISGGIKKVIGNLCKTREAAVAYAAVKTIGK